MEEYNGVQESYRDKSKERIQKQLQYGKQWGSKGVWVSPSYVPVNYS